MTAPLLLHSARERTSKSPNQLTYYKHYYKTTKHTLAELKLVSDFSKLFGKHSLCQSPLHRVCLFCVCILNWRWEHRRIRATKAEPSVCTSLGSAYTGGKGEKQDNRS